MDAETPAPFRALLRDIFGYESFRGQQEEIIRHVADGGDALVVMPTGGGKSLTYQIPALYRPGLGVVVSPLVALMADQVEQLRQLGVRAAALNAQLAEEERRAVVADIREGRLDLLYVSPERMLSNGFLDFLARTQIALFAIDEAHCVSQWGHDFRPEYRGLKVLAERFAEVPRMALTATADAATRRDIAEQLALEQGRAFVAGFDRPNIRYHVALKDSARQQLLRFLKQDHAGDSGIVYCLSRRKVEETAAWLEGEGFRALPYHAGLPAATRAEHQARFLKEEGLVMTATIAFGMGINKPDVRFVAHLDLPKSVESYYQETGRAGRDGLPADAWMVYGIADVAKLTQMIEASDAPDEIKRVERRKLNALLGFCETTRCRRQVLLGHFGDSCEPCGNCDTCLAPPESFDGTEAAQKLLSAIYRTGETFGIGHLVDVLTGRSTEKTLKFGHETLSVFGIGSEFNGAEWRSIARQLAAAGLIRIDLDGHGSFKLGEGVRPVLRGETPVRLRRDVRPQRLSRALSSKRSTAAPEDPEVLALFEALREKRRALAREQAVPPYIVFTDATLIAIAEHRPESLADMAALPGVGRSKLERYGEIFLAVVAQAGG